MSDPSPIDSPAYWNDRYLTRDTAWDIGAPSVPLQTYFAQLTRKDLSILIPGCGNAYEAEWLLDNGFTHISILDISPVLTQALREKFASRPASSSSLTILTADFFTHEGQYDLIVEQTFFCALPPLFRKNYMEKMHALLRPGGRLAGLLFDRQFPDGPPFGGTYAEYKSLLEDWFHIRTLSSCYNSIRPRMGTELFFIAEK